MMGWILCIFHNKTAGTAGKNIAHANIGIQNLTGTGVGVVWADGKSYIRTHKPADGRMTRIQRIPIGIGGLVADFDGVGEADTGKGFIPFQHTHPHRSTVFFRNVFIQPIDDGLNGFALFLF